MGKDEMSHDFQRAFGLLNVNNHKAAIALFEKDLQVHPDNFAALNNIALAQIHLGIGQKDPELLTQAIANLEKAIHLVNEVYKYKNGFPIAEANLTWAREELTKLP